MVISWTWIVIDYMYFAVRVEEHIVWYFITIDILPRKWNKMQN